MNETQNLLKIDLDIADQLVNDDINLAGRRDSYQSPTKILDEVELGEQRKKLNKWFPV